jgi:hypothetical protein
MLFFILVSATSDYALYGKYVLLVINLLLIVCVEQYMIDFYINDFMFRLCSSDPLCVQSLLRHGMQLR